MTQVFTKERYQARVPEELPSPATLELELRGAEPQALTTFRDAFLRWLNDRSTGLGRVLGAHERIAVDEPTAGEFAGSLGTLRIRISWPGGDDMWPAADTGHATWLSEYPLVGSSTGPADAKRHVFFPDAATAGPSLYGELPAAFGPVQPFSMGQGWSARMRGSAQRTGQAMGPILVAAREIARRQARTGGVRLERATFAFGARLGAGAKLGLSAMRGIGSANEGSRHGWKTFGGLAAAGSVAIVAGFLIGTAYMSDAGKPGAARLMTSAMPAPSAPSFNAAAPAVARVEPSLSGPAARADRSAAPVAPAKGVPASAAAPAAAKVGPAAGTPASPRSVREPVPQTAEGARSTDTTSGSGVRLVPVAARSAAVRAPEAEVVTLRETGGSGAVAGRRARGALVVRSEPQGAEVSINGVAQGRTPLVIKDVSAGSRVVRLDLPGYERWSWAIAVAADKQTPVSVKLQPELRAAGGTNH